MTGVLYISYDGMLEPLGQSQVLGYIERLAAKTPIHLISFEKPEDWSKLAEREKLTKRIAASGVVWHALPYHRRPSAPATAYDIAQGIRLGTKLVRRHNLKIIHARSYVPSVMALAIKRVTGARYLFDMRGFWADERVDAGLWPRDGRLYKFAKWYERRFLLNADGIVSLTEAAKEEISAFPYLLNKSLQITVIPTCADLNKFYPSSTVKPVGFTLGYVGTVGNWYDFDRTAHLFQLLRSIRSDAHFLIVNRGEEELIRSKLYASGASNDQFTIVSANHNEVPNYIRQMTAGILISRPAYSHIARAPTKLAEFLGCGVPCLVNSGVGDMGSILISNSAGVVVDGSSEADSLSGVRSIIAMIEQPETRARCVATAWEHFSLDSGVAAYTRLYHSLEASQALQPRTVS